jgi:hypothetical protein
MDHSASKQLPAIADALKALPVESVMLDGKLVICGSDGRADALTRAAAGDVSRPA